ncbi:MAG TPA: Uma2 family endonuclease [Tepidisphaeraceae bacterium]|nr:Uma2 family endonuclease [Tepidisphaeraceae bacterium]
MTLAAAPKTYTPEEFLNLPDSVGYELVDGQLVERHVSEKSSGIGAYIIYLLTVDAEKTREAKVYGADLSYQCFPDDPGMLRRPDVSLVRRSRLAELDNPGTMPLPADLVVEVLSPNDLAYDVDRKIELYLEAGFGLVWVVNPEMKVVTVHRPDGSVSRLHEKDEITGESALPSFRRKVAEFFPS